MKGVIVTTLLFFVFSLAQADPLQANFSHSIDWSNPFKVNFRDLSTPSFVNLWTWEFGDGSVSTEMNPSHIYSFVGEYTVKLTVQKDGQTSTYSKTITVNTQVRAIISASTTSGPPPLTVDLSCAASTGLVTGHTWSISPGNGFTYVSGDATSINPTVQFNVTGQYTVTLVVTDGGTPSVATQTITVKSQPIVDFTWTAPVYVNTVVQFQDQTVFSCQTGIAWQWVFPLSSSASQNPQYTFTTTGDFDVSLRVLDGCNNVVTKTKRITVTNQPDDLVSSFTSSKISIRRGETVDFYDTSQPRAQIVGWGWNFELPPDYEGVPHSDLFYTSYRDKVSHQFNTTGVFKVRLEASKNLSNIGQVSYQIVEVKESPELGTEYSKLLSAMDPSAQFITGMTLSGDVHAVAIDNKAVNVYKRVGGTEMWKLTEQLNQPNSYAVKVKNNAMMVYVGPTNGGFLYYFDAVGNSANNAVSIQATTQNKYQLLANSGSIRFDFYGNQVVYLNAATDGVYLYLVSKGTTWSSSTTTKVKLTSEVGTDLVTGNVFIDERYIVAHANGKAYVISKVPGGNTWDFANKKTIIAPGAGGFFRDIAYANNTIIGCYIPFINCAKREWAVAVLYEVGPSGWQDNMAPTASLKLNIDPEVDDNTTICEVQSTIAPNALSISDKYAAVKVGIRNGSSPLAYKVYVFKKFYDFWVDSYQTYKIYYTSSNFSPIVSSSYLMDHYAPQSSPARINIYNFDTYCTLNPYTATNFTINNSQPDVVKGIITLGGGTSAIYDTGAKINYVGTSITLKSNLTVKSGSTVIFTAVPSCDDLYYR